MTTSISSEARRNQISILIRGRENDGRTDRHTDGWTLVFIELKILQLKKSFPEKENLWFNN